MRWRRQAARVAAAQTPPPALTIEPAEDGLWRVTPGVLSGALPQSVRGCADALPLTTGALASVLVSFVGRASVAGERRALLAEIGRVLRDGATVVLVDHNRPRRRSAALAALVARPRVPGWMPGARWRRLGYPTAREAQEAGFAVERLELAARERVQIVVARKRDNKTP